MNDWAVLIVVYLSIFAASPLITILHESGHALAYLLLTKPGRVDILIGSYVKTKNPIKFKTGKLHFYIKRSFPFVKGIGLCRSYTAETNYVNKIIILLAGPVFTLAAAAIPAIIVFRVHANLFAIISCSIVLGFSALSLVSNLIPKSIDPSYNVNLDTDGKQILFALKLRSAYAEYIEALLCNEGGEFDLAIAKLESVLKRSPRAAQEVLRLLVSTSIYAKEYANALIYSAELESKFEFNAKDLLKKAISQSLTEAPDDAITTYSLVLKKEPNNLLALNNIASELVDKGAHEVAKRALDKALKISPKFDAPYNTLGYSKMLQGDFAEGKLLVDKCLELNPKRADAYKSLVIYYLQMKDAGLVTTNFNKAVDLDSTIDWGIYADELRPFIEQNAGIKA
jgi:tetratricopeptide (TPR) repeat protein